MLLKGWETYITRLEKFNVSKLARGKIPMLVSLGALYSVVGLASLKYPILVSSANSKNLTLVSLEDLY
jgi:hypothetical protein